MATKKNEEISKELKIALNEIGEISPWFDKKFKCWIYHHPTYPIECEGITEEEVILKYPEYLKTFIEFRLQSKLDSIVESKTKGRGGIRPGAGRPKGSIKSPTKQKRIPIDIAEWFDINPQAFDQIRQLMHKFKHA